ncbi:hypothetical protein ACFQS4_13005 [Saliphagus sp. GCM10025317]|uniref:hypothetical protein n=1 Tax=Natronosalvus halobius TaxID=2953746 RepID=UPI00209ECFF9|nr:hypothetical protein [Natronosalvus halobius]USZ72651.1 hypothetical protein NGM15_04870 [Natronosalvus halobius]
MAQTEKYRTYVILVMVCVLVSMNGFLLYYQLGWGATVAAVVVGLVLATGVTSLTTPLD